MDEHREHINQARDLLELAAQTPEGRADLRDWLGQVMESLGQQDGAQDVPASQDGKTTWNRRALARSGLEVALSADGDDPVVLAYQDSEPDGTGAYDNGRSDMPQSTEDQLREAWQQDEVARLSMMAQGGPQRPAYAGCSCPGRPGRTSWTTTCC